MYINNNVRVILEVDLSIMMETGHFTFQKIIFLIKCYVSASPMFVVLHKPQ